MRRSIAVAVTLLLASSGAIAAAEAIGVVKEVSGNAFLVRDGERLRASLTDPVHLYDTLETGPDGALGVLLDDDSRYSIDGDSSFTLQEYHYDGEAGSGSFVGRLARGALLAVSGWIAKLAPDTAKIETEVSTVGVRGTKMLIVVRYADPVGEEDR